MKDCGCHCPPWSSLLFPCSLAVSSAIMYISSFLQSREDSAARRMKPGLWSHYPIRGVSAFLSSGYLKKKKKPPFLIKLAGWVVSKALLSSSALIPLVGEIVLGPWNSGFETTCTVPALPLLVRRSIRPQEPRHVGTSSSSLLLSPPHSLLGRSQTQLEWSQSFRV